MTNQRLDALVSSAGFGLASLATLGFGSGLGCAAIDIIKNQGDSNLYNPSIVGAMSVILIATGVGGAKIARDYYNEYKDLKRIYGGRK